jgi:hypothetical protein
MTEDRTEEPEPTEAELLALARAAVAKHPGKVHDARFLTRQLRLGSRRAEALLAALRQEGIPLNQPPTILPLAQQPAFGLAAFAEGYEVGGLPARLVGVPWPSREFFQEEDLAGIGWVVCLDSEEPWRRYDPAPRRFLVYEKLVSPLTGDPEAVAALARVARLVDARLRDQEGVLIHCALGIERTGAVVGTVLALNGISPDRAAERIAALVAEQQPGWTGPRFAAELAAAIRRGVGVAAGPGS